MRLLGIISAFITIGFAGLGMMTLMLLPDEVIVDTRALGIALLIAAMGWQVIFLYCMDRKRDVEAEAVRYYQDQHQNTNTIAAE